MTEIKVDIRCRKRNAGDILCCAVRNASSKIWMYGVLSLIYVCETDDRDAAITAVQDDIDIAAVEDFGGELIAIG